MTDTDKYRLVICEKPSVAQAIAKVLGCGRKRDGCIEGDRFIVSWCIGHLVELADPEAYEEAWKKWRYDTLPMIPAPFRYEVKKETKGQFEILKGLMHDSRVSSVVNACDAGREGELIFRLVYEKAGCRKNVERLWLSSMEEDAIRKGFEHLKPGSNYDSLCESAKCRQRADWLVGLNATRLFTLLYQGKVLKVGRVMTPTLAMLVDRESAIMNFKKEPYYTAHIYCGGMDAVSDKEKNRDTAEKITSECEHGKAEIVSVQEEEKSITAPKLYDLTSLQRDANRLFGFTAKQTLEYTQSLYEKKLVTYPRTDSRYLSDDMGDTARNVFYLILEVMPHAGELHTEPGFQKVLNSRKVTDHHAIIPTLQIVGADFTALSEGERKVLFMVATRLLCAVSEAHVYLSAKAVIECSGHTFHVHGKKLINNGWKAHEEALRKYFNISNERDEDDDEGALPVISEGQTFDVDETKVEELFTKPPRHYSEDTLLKAMEKAGADETDDDAERKGLGTPATRADIIEKLVQGGFVKRDKKQMRPTQEGIRLITVLPDVIKSPHLTAEWENSLTLIAKGKYSPEEFMRGIESLVRELVEQYSSVAEEDKKMFAKEAGRKALGTCPKCGKNIVTGKYGAYCEGKCGMNVNRALGTNLTEDQIKNLLEGKKIFVKGLKGKKGSFDAYLIPEGTEDYSYMKDGRQQSGTQFKVKLEFKQKNKQEGMKWVK